MKLAFVGWGVEIKKKLRDLKTRVKQ